MNTTLTEDKCRLCSGDLSKRFKLNMLRKYNVEYYECQKCCSLQTEAPYWIDEAYRSGNLSKLDTGAAQRVLQNFVICYIVARLFKLNNVIDLGGGDGLLCRLLRDYQINCFVKDKYAAPTYAQEFTEPDFSNPDLVIGFELLEHLVSPETELDELFGYKPRVLLVSTELYSNQRQDWWYLVPDTGQHVFFYSTKALSYIARKYNYRLFVSGSHFIFIKPALLTTVRLFLLRFLLKNSVYNVIKSLLTFFPTPGVWRDHNWIKSKSS